MQLVFDDRRQLRQRSIVPGAPSFKQLSNFDFRGTIRKILHG
jgi:hypothetical protein